MDIDGSIYCPRCMRKLTETDPTVSACPLCGRKPTTQRPPMALDTGTLLAGRYQLGDVIGQGGFGITYAGWDETLGMPVAIKEYFPRDEAARNADESDDLIPMPGKEAVFADGLSRFRRESNLLASLQGIPCVVKVLDYFSENGTAYIVMEFVHGKPIDQWVRENRIKPATLLDRLRPVFDALVRTHSQGVIHRDITPDNLLVEEDGSFKLIDFGSAVEVDRSTGTVVLTRRYAPVEQYSRDFGQQGPWTDVYGLAAVLYAIISGEEPVEAPLRAHHDEQRPLTRRHTSLKRYQATAIDNALTVAPEKRTQSMAEFRARLYHLPLPEEVIRRKRFMHRMIAVAAILMVVLAAVVLNFTTGLPIGNGLIGSFHGNGVYIMNHLLETEEQTIPDTVLGIPVTSIRYNAFRGDTVLKRIEIPGTVKEIGDSAFYGCTNLEEITLAEGVESIGLSAFGACNRMISLTIPKTVTSIGEGAISEDAALLTVWGSRDTAAERYTNEHDLRFSDASELIWEIVNGEATLTEIHTNSERLTLPNHVEDYPVTGIAEGICLADQKNVWLPEYLEVIPESLFYMHKYEDPLSDSYYLNEEPLPDSRYSHLEHVRIGSRVREIGPYAFYLSEISEIVLPDTLRIIGMCAFAESNLSKVDLPNSLLEIQGQAFCNSKVKKLSIPESVQKIGQGAFGCIDELTELNIPNGLESITIGAFKDVYLDTLIIPTSVKSIESSAFSYCGLQRLILPEGVQSIHNLAFENNRKLRYIQIPDTVTQISPSAFEGCSDDLIIGGHTGSYAEIYADNTGIHFDDIDQWTLPDSLLGEEASYHSTNNSFVHVPLYNPIDECLVTNASFRYNQQVESIILSPFQVEISSGAFKEASSLKSVQTIGRIQIIKAHAFTDCSALEDIQLRDVTQIDAYAFEECTALRELQLLNLERMGVGAFQFCISLTELNLNSDRIIEIPNGAFYGCRALVKADLPSQLRVISTQAFTECLSLSEINFPEQLRTIDEQAFRDCISLTEIEFPYHLLTIGNSAFEGCTALTCIILPSSLQNLSSSSFNDCDLLQLVITRNGSTADGFSCQNCKSLKAIYYAETTPYLSSNWLKGCDQVTDIWIYNPDMEISSTGISDIGNLTIHGFIGSTADMWAKQNQVDFKPIPDGESMPDPEEIIAAFDFDE